MNGSRETSKEMPMRRRVTSVVMPAAAFVALFVAGVWAAGQQGGAANDSSGRSSAPARGGQRGQRGAQPVAGPTPRLPNGKPDLSGHWANPYAPNMAARGTVVDPVTRMPLTFPRQGEVIAGAAAAATNNAPKVFDLPYTEWGLKKWKEYDPVNNGDYAGSCLPFGMSRNMNAPHGLQIIQNNDAVAFLFEQNTWFHWVPTNGMKWPEDLPRTWNGVSTGRWEGDTLIIETTGFNGYTRLDTGGHPHSKELKMINTLTRTDSRTIQHTVTIHDPKAYTRDWMNVRTWRIKDYPDVIMEYSCEENNLQNLFSGAIKVWKVPEDDDN
jgi:hypothetical protein